MLRAAKMKHFRSYFFWLVVFPLCIFSLLFFILPLHTQNVSDIMVTEIMHSENDWVEVMNTTDSSITMTDLFVQVDDGTLGSVTVHGSTPATLAAGKVAVIVSDASAFTSAYGDYSVDNIYVSTSLSLPDSRATLKLKEGSDEIESAEYVSSNFSKLKGVSLHRTLGGVFLPAPVTPGLVAINPVSGYMPVMVGVSVSTNVTGGTEKDDRVFVSAGDVVTLHVLAQSEIVSPTASLDVGGVDRPLSLTKTSGAGGVMHSGTYTLVSGDADGVITYTVTYSGGDPKTGTVTHNGKAVSVDTTSPTVTSAISDASVTTRKVVTFTIEDENSPAKVLYKVSSTPCGTQSAYSSDASEEEKVAVVEAGEVRIVLSDSADNGKYVCVKVADKAGNTVYDVSNQVSGITASSLRITELVYAPADGASFEWLEVVNKGNSDITVTDFIIVDGGRDKRITPSVQGNGTTVLTSGQVAVIVRNEDDFKSKYPAYQGLMFKSTFSLNDTGDTIGLKSSDSTLVDQVSYVKGDGAYRNGKSLHVRNDGSVFEGFPSPSVVTEDSASAVAQLFVPQYAEDVLVKVEQFNGQDVVEGQNLFFTKDDSATVTFSVRDKETAYTELTISDYLTEEVSSSNNNSYRTERTSVEEQLERGVVEATYTIHFSAISGSVADNRITLYPKLTDGENNVSSKRSAVTVVRNSSAPSVSNPSNATMLGFPADENVIVPITVSGLVFGDWARPVYGGSCGDGLLSYIAKDGGHGVYYNLPTGSFTDCVISVRDSAGNVSDSLNLPDIHVGQT